MKLKNSHLKKYLELVKDVHQWSKNNSFLIYTSFLFCNPLIFFIGIKRQVFLTCASSSSSSENLRSF